jgi:hypothetical protein
LFWVIFVKITNHTNLVICGAKKKKTILTTTNNFLPPQITKLVWLVILQRIRGPRNLFIFCVKKNPPKKIITCVICGILIEKSRIFSKLVEPAAGFGRSSLTPPAVSPSFSKILNFSRRTTNNPWLKPKIKTRKMCILKYTPRTNLSYKNTHFFGF